jgi:adenine C2-methylase RlmN of 23S rRNA A2503 and tRNA A37
MDSSVFVTDFAEMSNISGKLREKLEKICEIKAPEVVHRNYSKDGTRKWVFRVGDGEGSLVETVLIPAEDKTGARKTFVFHLKWVVHWIVHSVRRVNKVSNVT